MSYLEFFERPVQIFKLMITLLLSKTAAGSF